MNVTLKRLLRDTPMWMRISAIGLVLLLIIWGMIPGSHPDLPSSPVESGEFIVDIKETGLLRAENSITVSAPPIRINLQIVDIIPEGTVVEKGDFLCQFDSAEIIQLIDDRKAELEIAEANLQRSLASMESQMSSMRSSVENSKASHRLAELRLEQMKFEADIRIEEGELNLKQAEISLQQSMEQIKSQQLIDSAEVTQLKLKIKQAKLELEKAYKDLEKLTLTAPAPGLVVYKEVWKGGEMSKLKVGDTPWRGMALLELPDLSVMLVETQVNEVDIARVKTGQEVIVKLDAYSEPTFHGEIIDVAVLANKDEGLSEAKVFPVLVRVKESDPLLRPGMSATAQIITARYEDEVWVPIESVFEKGNKRVVYELTGSSFKEHEVEIGPRNDSYVVVESGLEKGARVILVDPTLDMEEMPEVSQKSNRSNSTDNVGVTSTSRTDRPTRRPRDH